MKVRLIFHGALVGNIRCSRDYVFGRKDNAFSGCSIYENCINISYSTVRKSKCSSGAVGIAELRAHCYDFLSTSDWGNFIKFIVGIYFCWKQWQLKVVVLFNSNKIFLVQPPQGFQNFFSAFSNSIGKQLSTWVRVKSEFFSSLLPKT